MSVSDAAVKFDIFRFEDYNSKEAKNTKHIVLLHLFALV